MSDGNGPIESEVAAHRWMICAAAAAKVAPVAAIVLVVRRAGSMDRTI